MDDINSKIIFTGSFGTKHMKLDNLLLSNSNPGFSTGKDAVRIVPLGGAGNVTKNMFLYEYRYDGKLRDILIVDCGVGFPEPEMYGVDLVIPDIRYLEGKQDKIRGLVFTHGHDDHIGGITYHWSKLNNAPMWGTKLTAAFANVKLQEARIKNRVNVVDFQQIIKAGVFTVSFVRMTHSVPDAANLVIESPVGIFYHGSDFKFDFTPLDSKFSELDKITRTGKKGVLCLLTDCLGSERAGFTPSEQVIGETIEKELSMCHGKLLFTTQSSNISRIQLAIEIARKYGRHVAFIGRSIDKNVEAARHIGYMHFQDELIIRDRDLRRMPPDQQFLIVAGSQGQPGSAMTRIANDEHKFIHVNEGDTVIFSADPIPGNEANVNLTIEQLYRRGARVSYSTIMEDLHVSGHGSQGDLMLMLSVLGPKFVFPIGGTYKHIMQYRRLAQELGYNKNQVLIPDDGEILEFRNQGSPRIVEKIELENIMIDGLGIGDVGRVVLRDRQTIAKEGIVVVVVPIEKSSGRMQAEPDIISRGFVYIRESGDVLRQAKQVVSRSIRLKKGRIFDWSFVRKQIEENLSKFLAKETGRYPLIVPVILEV